MEARTIGRYEILREIGRGGMAVVLLARDPYMDRQVAIKVLPQQFTHDPTFLTRFQREAKVIASLEHPAIVPVYDFGEHGGAPFIVMRYMPGGSLADRLDKGPMSLKAAADLLNQLAPALDEAHRHRIVHRDMKPGNILFDQRGAPYLADFGIVKLSEGASTALTATGGSLGTPSYISPEQARGELRLDGRSDIYSLGVIFFEMLTGERPYNADTPMGVAVMHITEPVPQIRERKPDLPAACQTVIDKAMAKDKNARYATAADLASAVALLAEGKLPPPPKMPETEFIPPAFAQSPGQRRVAKSRRVPTWLLIAGGLALIAAAVLLVYGLGGGAKTDAWGTATNAPTSIAAAVPSSTPSIQAVAPTRPATVTASPMPRPTQTAVPSPPPTHTPAPTPTPGPREPSAFPLPGGGSVTMVWAPAGEFKMGTNDAEMKALLADCFGCSPNMYANEQPRHIVFLDAYWIDQTEVTNGQYAACEAAGACPAPGESSSGSREAYYGNPAYDNFPVIHVSWHNANTFCAWRDARLPTEAEWEKAARGVDGRTYPWGDGAITGELANSRDSNPEGESPEDGWFEDTSPVGYYPLGASPYGALDMAGNVSEWVADWYDSDYYGSPDASENPVGPRTGRYHVVRGGSWDHGAVTLRVAYRGSNDPGYQDDKVGFRCARDP
jgi:serine/threonine protein kinase/formylglycine-generating enzyme required for sulfatase activity